MVDGLHDGGRFLGQEHVCAVVVVRLLLVCMETQTPPRWIIASQTSIFEQTSREEQQDQRDRQLELKAPNQSVQILLQASSWCPALIPALLWLAQEVFFYCLVWISAIGNSCQLEGRSARG